MPKRKERTEPDKKTEELLERPLPPVGTFKAGLRQILTVSKEESDRQLAKYRAASRARRQQKT